MPAAFYSPWVGTVQYNNEGFRTKVLYGKPSLNSTCDDPISPILSSLLHPVICILLSRRGVAMTSTVEKGWMGFGVLRLIITTHVIMTHVIMTHVIMNHVIDPTTPPDSSSLLRRMHHSSKTQSPPHDTARCHPSDS